MGDFVPDKDDYGPPKEKPEERHGFRIPFIGSSNTPPIPKHPRDIFAPQTLDEYIGQEHAKRLITTWIKAAKIRNQPLPNILITGEFGLGKTSLAKLIMRDFTATPQNPKGKVEIRDANRMNILHLPETGTVIIDEIHNLSDEIMDSFNMSLDAGYLTIIGCTTDSGELSAPFRSRFRQIVLEPYTVEDLIQMITMDAAKERVEIPPELVVQMALRSRFNARAATQTLAMIIDVMSVNEETVLSEKTLTEAFELMELDQNGLRPIDRKYLQIIGTHTVGIQYISAMLGLDPKTIQIEIEPYLLRLGMVERTARGRKRVNRQPQQQ